MVWKTEGGNTDFQVFQCGGAEEAIHHLLLHCPILVPLGNYFFFDGLMLDFPPHCKRDPEWLEGIFCWKKATKSLVLNSSFYFLGSL